MRIGNLSAWYDMPAQTRSSGSVAASKSKSYLQSRPACNFLYFFQHSIFFKPSQMLSITNQLSLNIGDSLHLKRERANICTSYVHTLSPTLLERAISYFCMNSLNHKPCLEGGWAQLCMGISLYLDIIKILTMSMTGFSFCFSIMIRY